MKERPIIFDGESVRAILNVRPGTWRPEPVDRDLPYKFQTRRTRGLEVVNEELDRWTVSLQLDEYVHFSEDAGRVGRLESLTRHCPYGKLGDRLWVRETARLAGMCGQGGKLDWIDLWYAADEEVIRFDRSDFGPYQTVRRTSPIFMPRWASRVMLEIMRIRVRRLWWITQAELVAEGLATGCPERVIKLEFIRRWDRLNRRRGFPWMDNLWVWVVDFKRVPTDRGLDKSLQ